MRQSIPAAPSPRPRAYPRALDFFALDSKFPGVGTLELSNPLGWERKKKANAPSFINTATFFIDTRSNSAVLSIFNVCFFCFNNVFLCYSARILIKTSRHDDMHQFIILVLM